MDEFNFEGDIGTPETKKKVHSRTEVIEGGGKVFEDTSSDNEDPADESEGKNEEMIEKVEETNENGNENKNEDTKVDEKVEGTVVFDDNFNNKESLPEKDDEEKSKEDALKEKNPNVVDEDVNHSVWDNSGTGEDDLDTSNIEELFNSTQDVDELRLTLKMVSKQKMTLENELESLTAQLFGEANELVAGANKKAWEAEQERDNAIQAKEDSQETINQLKKEAKELKNMIKSMQKHQKTKPRSSSSPGEPPSRTTFTKLKNRFAKDQALPDFASTPMNNLSGGSSSFHNLNQNSKQDPEAELWAEFLEFFNLDAKADILETRYMKRVLQDDVYPCLNSYRIQNIDVFLRLMLNNDLLMEPAKKEVFEYCHISNQSLKCGFRFKNASPDEPDSKLLHLLRKFHV